MWTRVNGLASSSRYPGWDTFTIILPELFRKYYMQRSSLASVSNFTPIVGSPALRDRVTLQVETSFNHVDDLTRRPELRPSFPLDEFHRAKRHYLLSLELLVKTNHRSIQFEQRKVDSRDKVCQVKNGLYVWRLAWQPVQKEHPVEFASAWLWLLLFQLLSK